MPRPPHPRVAALGGFVDGRLPAWRRVLLEQHLDRCTGCALEVARIRSLRRLLADAPVPEPGPDLEERLLALGRPRGPVEEAGFPTVPAAPRRREPIRGVGVLTAALVLVAAVGAGAVVTGATTPSPAGTPGAAVRASLADVLPRLLTWPVEPGGALGVRPVDNDDRP